MKTSQLSDIAVRFLSRRDLLRGAAVGAVALSPLGALTATPARAAAPGLDFQELQRVPLDTPTHTVAAGYRAEVLAAWGDPLVPGAPAFDPHAQTVAAQEMQFGFNCDFIGYVPLKDGSADKAEHLASANSAHGLLGVNHEYSSPHLMFAGIKNSDEGREKATADSTAIERASLGHSIVEVRRENGTWRVVPNSPYARRFHGETKFDISGPARGHHRMKTPADPDGTTIRGTFANCAGGVTPWGTILSGEENIQNYFAGKPSQMDKTYWREAASAESFGVSARAAWGKFEDRFDVNKTPHEFNRHGWVIEVDPYNPQSLPKKRTALGRCRHEGATIVAKNGQPVVCYTGDDQSFQFIYKFVSSANYVEGDPAANADILESGVLYVAQFKDDGTGVWLPLVHGTGVLTSAYGFDDQGDVVIDTRRAAKLLGATECDRPEDIETDPITGRTYAAFTGGTDRKEAAPANSRTPNLRGHIVEIMHPGEDGARDHTATNFTWDILLLAGHPRAEAASKGQYGAGITDAGYFAQPDNLVFDPKGRLWLTTDGADEIGVMDGIWACCITGPERAVTKHFFSVPRGGEPTGPCFTPDGTTLFVSVQHPAQEKGSSFDEPSTRWPAAPDSALPPRPAVVVITREDGGLIGG